MLEMFSKCYKSPAMEGFMLPKHGYTATILLLLASVLNLYSVASSAHSISPVLLGRARTIAAEHSKLTKQLAQNYGNDIARRAGELQEASRALQEWETVNNVGLFAQLGSPRLIAC